MDRQVEWLWLTFVNLSTSVRIKIYLRVNWLGRNGCLNAMLIICWGFIFFYFLFHIDRFLLYSSLKNSTLCLHLPFSEPGSSLRYQNKNNEGICPNNRIKTIFYLRTSDNIKVFSLFIILIHFSIKCLISFVELIDAIKNEMKK